MFGYLKRKMQSLEFDNYKGVTKIVAEKMF